MFRVTKEELLSGRWYRRGAEVGQVRPRATLADYTPVSWHVPHPVHVESTIWRLLAEEPTNDAGHPSPDAGPTAPGNRSDGARRRGWVAVLRLVFWAYMYACMGVLLAAWVSR